MKATAARLTFFATTILAATFAAAPASAQNLKGEIPFQFKADHSAMNPGVYSIAPASTLTGTEPVVLRNLTDGKTVIAGVVTQIQTRGNEQPRIEFACHEQDCRLVRIFDYNRGWQVVQAHDKVEKERLQTVYLTRQAVK
jgi:hypothetical protein